MYMQPHLSFMDNILFSHCTCISNLIIDWSLNFTSSTKYNVPLKKKSLKSKRFLFNKERYFLSNFNISFNFERWWQCQMFLFHIHVNMMIYEFSQLFHQSLRTMSSNIPGNHVFKLNSKTALISILHFSKN